jgi:DNA polymerase-4
LEALGVATIGDLARRERAEVVAEFGATGAWIHDLAHGLDARRVTPRREEKSHGMERTFPANVSDRDELRRHLLDFCEEVAFALRDKGLRGRTITLKARYADFTTLTRTKTLDHPTNLAPRIYAVTRELLERLPIAPLRLLGVQVSALSDVRAPIQESLFGDLESGPRLLRGGQVPAREKLERATEGLDRLRRKYGARAVVPASLLGRARTRGRGGEREHDGQGVRDGDGERALPGAAGA